MHAALPPLNALRAFEAAARHLSLTKAAAELNVTAGALSHQIRGLESYLSVKLFDRGVRSLALTPAGKALHPGLQAGFGQIREALARLTRQADPGVLVVSTPPGFTSKWLAPRLYRFSLAHPEIDVRVSSSIRNADFVTDGVDAAIRNLPADYKPDEALVIEKLFDLTLAPVCSPSLLRKYGALASPDMLKRLPLIHDESTPPQAAMPAWAEWLAAAGVEGVPLHRGLRFSSGDHALDATLEGAGVLLATDVLAHDDLRTGRLVRPFDIVIPARRCYAFVCLRAAGDQPKVKAFRAWLDLEIAALAGRAARKRTARAARP